MSSKAIRQERWIKLTYFLVITLGLILAIAVIENMLVSMLLAFVTYYMMAPLVDWIESRGLSRMWATSIPFLGLSVLLGGSIVFLSPSIVEQIQAIQANADKYVQIVNQALQNLESRVNSIFNNIYPIDVRSHIEPYVGHIAGSLFKEIPNVLSKSISIAVMGPFLAFYMLMDGRDIIRKILAFVPNHLFELVLNLNDQIGSQMGGFIRARLIETLFVGLLTWVGLIIIGFPYALLMGATAGILNIIPYVGPIIAAVPAVLISLVNDGGTQELVGLAIVYSVAQFVDHWVLIPFLVARIVDLHAVTVVVVVIAGAQWGGVLGMIISIPLVSILKVSFLEIYQHLVDFRD